MQTVDEARGQFIVKNFINRSFFVFISIGVSVHE